MIETTRLRRGAVGNDTPLGKKIATRIAIPPVMQGRSIKNL
jgi:hypothetical protein